nr:MAG TPA: hypothetical protein [Caudoviricetes sp.]
MTGGSEIVDDHRSTTIVIMNSPYETGRLSLANVVQNFVMSKFCQIWDI